MTNKPEQLSLEDITLLQRKLYNYVMDGLSSPDVPAVIVTTAYKFVDSARLDPDTGDVTAQLIDELPEEFKVHIKKTPEWDHG